MQILTERLGATIARVGERIERVGEIDPASEDVLIAVTTRARGESLDDRRAAGLSAVQPHRKPSRAP